MQFGAGEFVPRLAGPITEASATFQIPRVTTFSLFLSIHKKRSTLSIHKRRSTVFGVVVGEKRQKHIATGMGTVCQLSLDEGDAMETTTGGGGEEDMLSSNKEQEQDSKYMDRRMAGTKKSANRSFVQKQPAV